jgi:FkbM family methyltransferase
VFTEPTTTSPDATDMVKSNFLRAADLAMLASASNYDVESKEDRARSSEDLTRLFFRASSALGVDLFIEAGAKDASSSRRARRLLDPKRVVAFEANPYTYKRFAAQNADCGVEYVHLALSNEPGPVTFNVLRNDEGRPRADGQSSILRRQTELGKGFIEATVDAVTLDDFFRDHEFESAALWVDVEGATHLVLSGAKRMLVGGVAIAIVEVEDRRFWGAEQWLHEDVISFMYDCGFSPVARDFQSRYQYNVVFVRSDLLTLDRLRWAITRFNSAGRPRLQAHSDVRMIHRAAPVLGAPFEEGPRLPLLTHTLPRSVRARVKTVRHVVLIVLPLGVRARLRRLGRRGGTAVTRRWRNSRSLGS